MNLKNIDRLLENVTKLRLILVIGYNEEKTLFKITSLIKREFKIQVTRKSIFRAIKSMIGSGFVIKSYNDSKRVITYKLT